MSRNDENDLHYPLNKSQSQSSMSYDNRPVVYQPPAAYTMQGEIITSNQNEYKVADQEGALGHLKYGLSGLARKNFIKKVYSIVGLQLLFTAAMCVISTYVQEFMKFQIQNYGLMYVSLALMIVTEIVILCSKIGRKHPYNLIALGLFTLGEAYLVSFISALVADAKGGAVVLMAVCMTVILVGCLTLYAIFAKTDFTTPWAILMAFVASIVMFLMFLLIRWTTFSQTLFCSIGIFVFGVYLIIDTQMIFGGKSFTISIDDYVVAALLIYIDIIQLFLYILQILGARR